MYKMDGYKSLAVARTISYLVAITWISIVCLNFEKNIMLITIFSLSSMLILGLNKMVYWARYIANILFSFTTLFVFFALMPISGRPEIHFFEVLFGKMPNNIILWIAIIIFSIIVLWPLYIFSNNKSKFRDEAW